MAEMITAIAGAVIGIAGFIFGIIKWRDERRERKNSQERQKTKDFVAEKIKEEISPIKENIEDLKNLVDDNEKDRLRAEIMIFVHELKNNQIVDGADFKHIHHVYDKYHNMGGNSYIDEDMEYIRMREREINERNSRE